MKSLSYSTIIQAQEVWDHARFCSKDSDAELGRLVFEKTFELQPEAKRVFGQDGSDEANDDNKAFQTAVETHTTVFPLLMDSVLQMLGPDTDFVQEILKKTGERHKVIGCSPSFLPFMGVGLVYAIEKTTGKPLTKGEREPWDEVYEAVSLEMTKSMLG